MALLQLPVDSYLGVLAVHFLDNLVQLHLHFSKIKAAEQLIGLQGICPCELAGGLQPFFDRGEFLLLLIL
jgi:hypothetical protein